MSKGTAVSSKFRMLLLLLLMTTTQNLAPNLIGITRGSTLPQLLRKRPGHTIPMKLIERRLQHDARCMQLACCSSVACETRNPSERVQGLRVVWSQTQQVFEAAVGHHVAALCRLNVAHVERNQMIRWRQNCGAEQVEFGIGNQAHLLLCTPQPYPSIHVTRVKDCGRGGWGGWFGVAEWQHVSVAVI